MFGLNKLVGVAVYLAAICEAANILAVYTVLSPSHYVLISPLLKELALSGHNVTVLSLKQTKNLPPNYNEIFVELPQDLLKQIEG